MHSFRREAHTGENRCWPCTVTNLLIAALLAGALALVSPIVAGAFFVVGVLLIAFLGYLVPGTPYLTRKYFPDRVLTWFGKAPPDDPRQAIEGLNDGGDDGGVSSDGGDDDGEIDVDRLVAAGALTVGDDDSLSLDPDFEDRWWSRMTSLREDEGDQRETFASIVGVDPGAVRLEEEAETETFTVTVGEDNFTQWMSRAAFVADVAANDVLASVDPDWSTLSLLEHHKLSMGLRQLLDACPLCDAPLIEVQEETASCCWSIHAITTRCEECGSRMYVV